MPLTPGQIRNYLSPDSTSSFWGWSQDGDSVDTCFGTTIAFHQEVWTVLRQLQPHGLPAFEELILLLAACRRDWDTPGGLRQELSEYLSQFNTPDWPDHLLAGLDRAHTLYLSCPTLPGKSIIAEKVFEAAYGQQIDADNAESILLSLESGDSTTLVVGSPPNSLAAFSRDSPSLHLSQSIKSLTDSLPFLLQVESLTLRALTGFDDLPQSAEELEVEVPPVSLSVQTLLSDLENDPSELGGLVHTARQLMAAIHLPRSLSDPDRELQGGFSDIANRGSLDRLLLTELAQDDDVLATRVALNEALYLQRESPPRNPPRTRAIFIDTSIRMWGIPRAFAHSAALALAGTSDIRDEILVYSADDSSRLPLPADLTTRQGLTEQLGRLSPAPHPAPICQSFLETLQETGDTEPVLITHPDTLQEPDFLQALRQSNLPAIYLFTVASTGRCELLCHTRAGLKPLNTFLLDPSHLLQSENGTPIPLLKQDPSLPFALQREPFPLRIAAEHQVDKTLYHPDHGAISRSRDGLLLCWDHPGHGARVIPGDAPFGTVQFSAIDPDFSQAVYLLEHQNQVTALHIDLTLHRARSIPFFQPLRPILGGILCADVLILWNNQEAASWRFVDNQLEGSWSVPLPGPIDAVSGHYVRSGGKWYAFRPPAYPGLIELPFGDLNPLHTYPVDLEDEEIHAIDREGTLWTLTQQGTRATAVLDVTRSLDGLIAATPQYAVFSSKQGFQPHWIRVDLQNHTAQLTQPPIQNALYPEFQALTKRTCSIRKRIRSIGIFNGHTLAIISSSGTKLAFTYQDKSFALRPISVFNDNKLLTHNFEPVESPSRTYQLQKASWPDGSAAYLDSRGFLHLVSSNPDLPEITLALRDGSVSAWLSNDKAFGHPFFLGTLTPHSFPDLLRPMHDFIAQASGSTENTTTPNI